MAFFTESQFQQTAQNVATAAFESINESRSFSKSTATTSIFLSHAHDDRKLIAQAKTIFEHLNIRIYVDWADETMPKITSGVTAQKIKKQIISNDKFVLLATNRAVASKWCNWEVGYGDATKLNSGNMALLPLADNSGTWNGNEYLQIYPRIETMPSGVVVIYPNGQSEPITNWLLKRK